MRNTKELMRVTVENLEINVKTNAGTAASQIRSLSNALGGVQASAKSAGGASRTAAKGVSDVASAAKKAVTPLGKFVSSLKRIAYYRMIRGRIKEIAKAFEEGLKNAYHFSKGINGTLAAALDRVSTKSLTMKNQLGSAFGGLLQAIQPILLRIIELIRVAANAIAAFFGAFNGGEYLRAKDTATAWDDATTSAGEYKKTILGFDEINRLDSPSGGGGAKALDYASMFELAESPLWLQDLVLGFKDVLFNWDDLNKEQIAAKLLTGLGGITGGLIGFAFGGLKGGLVGTIAGIALGAVLSSLIFDGDGRLSKAEITQSLLSALAILAGGVIGFVAGGLVGAAIGISVAAALVFGINALIFAFREKKKEEFYNTEIGKLEKQISEEIAQRRAKIENIVVSVESITGEIDEDTEVKLGTAANLIRDIFNMDEIENKTTTEVAILTEKINALNGLGLDGIRVEFDETTGRVKGTKDALDKVLENLREEIAIEAMRDSLVEAYKLQTAAELELASAEETLKNATDAKKLAIDEVNRAYEAYNNAINEYQNYIKDNPTYEIESQLRANELYQTMTDLANAYLDAQNNVKYFDQDIQNATANVNLAKDAVSLATDKVGLLEDKLVGLTSKTFDVDLKINVDDAALRGVQSAIVGVTGGYLTPKLSTDQLFASGGFPDQGSLFVAGEAGAEIVSTSSTGQTQVSNTNQIAASVSVGNVGVVQAINDLIRAVENKDTSPVVTIGDRDVYRASQRGQQKVGRSLVATV